MMHNNRTLLLLAGICLISAEATSQTNSTLQPFTAKYQLNRGNMLVGKVTNKLHLEPDGSYKYTSMTKTVGIAAVFSKDKITEISKGKIINSQVTPSEYSFEHKRKKRPKYRKQEFDWSTNRLSILEPKPVRTIKMTKGVQDKASMVLAMMQAFSPDISKINLQVADKKKLKQYQITKQGEEQINAGGIDYKTLKLAISKPGEAPNTKFWLAPELNNLPIKIEKMEKKKETYTMILVEYTPGQPAEVQK
jgi:hypothetical protein